MSGGDTQQGPPPPPQQGKPSGSPFGRFLTSPVLVVAMLALVVSFATFRYIGDDGGGTSTAPEPTPTETSITGKWTGEAIRANAAGGGETVQLELDDDGTGTLTRADCTGTLTPSRTMSDAAVFDYTETSGTRGCPRRTRVTVELDDAGTLRFEERRLGGRPFASGTLERR